MSTSFRLTFFVLILSLTSSSATTSSQIIDAEAILQNFVDDFCLDPFASTPTTFGIRIRGEHGGDWHVVVEGRDESALEESEATLVRGFPFDGVGYFDMDLETLVRVDRGELSVMTAMGKARESDHAPVEFHVTEGHDPGTEFWTRLSPLIFHFWHRGLPEIVPFGESYSRKVHGANVVSLYYQPGLRTVWYQLRPDQHINPDPRDQTNDFPSLFIFTKGRAQARIGGEAMRVEEGQALFVPPGISHEFEGTADSSCEFVLIMFGEGA